MTPHFFGVTKHIPIKSLEFGLPSFIATFFYVEFGARNLEHPGTEPIGVYFYSGNRRYLWRDKFWAEYEPHYRLIERQIDHKLKGAVGAEADYLRDLLAGIREYTATSGPHSYDTPDNPVTQAKTFHRIIYEINGSESPATDPSE